MAGGLLTVASTLQCPHGGSVQVVPSNPRSTCGGVPLAMSTDTFVVSSRPIPGYRVASASERIFGDGLIHVCPVSSTS